MTTLRADCALLIIDVINHLEFPGAENLLPWARKMAGRLVPLRREARRSGIPVIYVNDNSGRRPSDFTQVYEHCVRPGVPGREIAAKLKPGRSDYFVLKPRHSAFFATSLIPLLEHLGTRQLLLTGIATNLCVLFTAHDAHMHEYKLVVASDCCAAESDFDHDVALSQLQKFCGATIRRSDELRFPNGTRRK